MGLRILINFGRFRGLEPVLDHPWSGVVSAALGLAWALAERGHEIHIFAESTKKCSCDGVWFHDRANFAAFAESTDVDALITIPPVLTLLMPVRAKARVVWTGNGYSKGDGALSIPWQEAANPDSDVRSVRLYRMSMLEPYLDLVVTGSAWQAKRLRERAGLPREKIEVIYLGVPLQFYNGKAFPKHRHRLVFTSNSRYGLDPLLAVFPSIRQSVTDAELHIFGCEYKRPSALQQRQAQVPSGPESGVYWRGAYRKSALAAELRSAALMAYPNLVKETFSLAVAEAQAAGIPVVTSWRGALRERVTDGIDGFLIPGKPDEPEYQRAFLDAVIRLLHDDDLWQQLSSNAASKAAREYSWSTIAAHWERKLQELTAGRKACLPAVNPKLNLLDPALLHVVERTYTVTIKPEQAREWLSKEWMSYGYDADQIPGLVPA